MKEVERLLSIMATLRNPEKGCPWDLQQTHATILPHTIEEVYELAEAIQGNNTASMRDELGDLLFQIIFYCQMSSESGDFAFADVVHSINEKLTRRHPHVFADESIEDADAQSLSWERIKMRERQQAGHTDEGLLDSVCSALPALVHAMKLQKKAATVGFDWDEPGPVLDKIEEELEEIRAELTEDIDRERLAGEIGDVLFACANFARHYGINPEMALMQTNRKFRYRFGYIEAELRARGKTLGAADVDEMEALWEAAKGVKG